MAKPQTSLDVAGAPTDASGSVDLSELLDRYESFRIVCTCAASVTWTFNAGVASGRKVQQGTASALVATFSGDGAPWPAAEIAWSGNSTNEAIYVDVVVYGSRQR